MNDMHLEPLTERQRRFVKAYVMTGCAASAARDAGYSKYSSLSYVYHMLKRPDVQRAIEIEKVRLEDEVKIGHHEVVEGLWKIARDRTSSHASRVAALSTLGRFAGLGRRDPQKRSGVVIVIDPPSGERR